MGPFSEFLERWRFRKPMSIYLSIDLSTYLSSYISLYILYTCYVCPYMSMAYTCPHVYIYIYICIYTDYLSLSLDIYIYTHMIYIYIYIHTHLCVCVHMVCMYTYTLFVSCYSCCESLFTLAHCLSLRVLKLKVRKFYRISPNRAASY